MFTPHKQFQTCHAHGVIDADLSRSRRGIVKKATYERKLNMHR